ncbi:hypothetical protein ACFX16_009708 [Malus domestica]
MADKENCLRVMRSMKRRPEAAVTPEQPSTKKRVVLGELLNAVVPTNKMSGAEKQIEKPGAKGKAKKAVPLTKTIQQPEAANDVDAVSDDPQMCAPYARDIYEYLQKLEADEDQRPSGGNLSRLSKNFFVPQFPKDFITL